MRTAFSLALFLALAPRLGTAAELSWTTDLGKAQAQANAQKKSVLLFFHGSDWCPACTEMERQVFSSPEFIAYAHKALVLVDVDFPEKTKQDPALKQANLALKEKFNVGENFPTLVLLDDSGKTVFQEAGYGGGGPAEVLPNLQRHAKLPAASAGEAGFTDVDVAQFSKLAADKKNVILDVRTQEEFEAGHIPGAINLDVLSPDFQKKSAALDRSKTYLVHCATGIRSARACKQLAQWNFPSLYNLVGGFKAWQKAGEPVQK